MDNKVAEVSVVIPVYNQAQFLRECLKSLTDQSFNDWEAIVVDDASTQGDPEQMVVKVTETRREAEVSEEEQAVEVEAEAEAEPVAEE